MHECTDDRSCQQLIKHRLPLNLYCLRMDKSRVMQPHGHVPLTQIVAARSPSCLAILVDVASCDVIANTHHVLAVPYGDRYALM